MTTGVELRIRPAEAADSAAIAAIYNAGIAERIATFESEPRPEAEIRDRIAGLGPRQVMVVAAEGDRVVGAAWYGGYSPRACYAGVGDYSVYVDPAARGRGVGRRLVEELVAAARERGLWKLVGRIFPENGPSLVIAERAGFRRVGVHRRHARLDGVWRDVVVVERLIEENCR